LHQKYQKPVFLPYIAVASGVWFDEDKDGEIDNEEFDPDGWNDKIVNVYKNLKKKGQFYWKMAFLDMLPWNCLIIRDMIMEDFNIL